MSMSGLLVLQTPLQTQQSISIDITTIAPNWSSRFQKWESLRRYQKDEIMEDLAYVNKNVVAEARGNCRYWDQKDEQYCEECQYFCWSYNYVINQNAKDDELYLDKEIVDLKGRQFATHFYQYHENGGSSDTCVSKLSI